MASRAQIVFLALPHGASAEFARPLLEAGLRVIDLSADFRIHDPEVYRDSTARAIPRRICCGRASTASRSSTATQLRGARLVASAGCYPTSIILPLHPLLKQRLIDPASIVVSSLSGVSGAGRSAAVDFLFAECNENARPYGVPKHRHLAEIEQELSVARRRAGDHQFHPAPHPAHARHPDHHLRHAEARGDRRGRSPTRWRTPTGRNFSSACKGTTGTVELKNVIHSNFLDIAWRHDPAHGAHHPDERGG